MRKRSQIRYLGPRFAVGVWVPACMPQASAGYTQLTDLTQAPPPVVVILEGGNRDIN